MWPFNRKPKPDHAELYTRTAQLSAEITRMQSNARQWQEYVKGVAKVVMAHERELGVLRSKLSRIDPELGERVRRLEVRTAELCLFISAPISDGQHELDAQVDEMIQRVVARHGGGS